MRGGGLILGGEGLCKSPPDVVFNPAGADNSAGLRYELLRVGDLGFRV